MRALTVVLIAAAAVGWACWLAVVPAIAAAGPSRPVAWAAAITYRAGALICHQQDARSLHVGAVRMPVCARCFGLYAGGALGTALAAGWTFFTYRFRRRLLVVPLSRGRWAAVASGLPMAAAWAIEHLGGVEVTGPMRAITALPLGAALAAIATLWAGGAAFDDTAPRSALHS